MRVLVTRPRPQADGWVERLRAAGIDAGALPLISIGEAPDPAAVGAAWATLSDNRLVVFVSPNAAARFLAARPVGIQWPLSTEAASIGPGTTQALRQAGIAKRLIVEPAEDSLQFDSEALWQRLGAASRDWVDASVLMVRGNGGRDWLADRLRERGARVEAVAAYTRAAPRFEGADRAEFDAAVVHGEHRLWLFSSSEAIDHLERACPGHDWHDAAAVATHPRIASRARALGFGSVEPSSPTFEAVLACIQSRAS